MKNVSYDKPLIISEQLYFFEIFTARYASFTNKYLLTKFEVKMSQQYIDLRGGKIPKNSVEIIIKNHNLSMIPKISVIKKPADAFLFI